MNWEIFSKNIFVAELSAWIESFVRAAELAQKCRWSPCWPGTQAHVQEGCRAVKFTSSWSCHPQTEQGLRSNQLPSWLGQVGWELLFSPPTKLFSFVIFFPLLLPRISRVPLIGSLWAMLHCPIPAVCSSSWRPPCVVTMPSEHVLPTWSLAFWWGVTSILRWSLEPLTGSINSLLTLGAKREPETPPPGRLLVSCLRSTSLSVPTVPLS